MSADDDTPFILAQQSKGETTVADTMQGKGESHYLRPVADVPSHYRHAKVTRRRAPCSRNCLSNKVDALKKQPTIP